MADPAGLAQRLAEFPPEKREALRSLLKRSGARGEGIRPRGPGARIPLAYGQQRLWLLDRLVPGTPAYNETNTLRLTHEVDVDAVRQAMDEIVRRHEVLRTVFRMDGDEPVQLVLPSLALDIPVTDLRGLPREQREAEAHRLATVQSRVPFDLSAGPLIRVSLLRLDTADHVFVLTLHHIVTDGWSLGVFCVEFFTFYWGIVTRRPVVLPELSVQYGDFAIWQRASLDGQVLGPQLTFWKKQLADLQPIDLPADRPRPTEFSFRGARLPLVIGGALHRGLLALCRHQGVTLFVLLLAAFYVLLHRYTDQDDLAVGCPVAGRNQRELEPIMGFFINTLVLRADLSGNPSFADFLDRVRDLSVEAFANQRVPFERVVDELQPPRDKSRNPLFQVAFQVFERPSAPGLAKEALVPFVAEDTGIAKFDLMMEWIRTDDETRGQIEYCSDLFDRPRIERMAGHYLRLLEGIVADPRQSIGALRLLAPEDEHRLVVEWNRTAASFPRDSTVHAELRAQAHATPEAVAVAFDGRETSYADLDRASDRLARRLAALGVARGEPVGVHLGRCAELPAVLLAVLKAGAAFVPLDPAYPRARLGYMLADSGARFAITATADADGLEGLGARPITLDELAADGAEAEPAEGTGATDPAYIMYTSATTGEPKGVAVSHRNILRLVKGVRYMELRPGQRMLQFSPVSFDASTFEIWGSLLNGGTLVLHPPGTPSLAELGAFIRDSRIDVLFLTPSLFRQMVEHAAASLRSVRQLIVGGEAMPPAATRAAWKALPRTRLVNGYGPTECTTFAVCYHIADPDDLAASVPIGRPIENTTAYLLDRYGNPVPVGIPGELHLGGDGVALGYWNRPERTAAAFVHDSLADPGTGGRLYRTGDICVFRENGTLLFLGRRDRQVKLNGYRIELAEVESAVATHPQVSASAVVLAGGDTGRRMVAFAERRPGSALTASALRGFLQDHLPRHMLPHAVELRDALPLNATGKVDYRALEDEADHLAIGGGGAAPPQSAAEQQLAALWSELLNVANVGRADNFFDLGGHSLIATRLLSRVRERLGVEVTMRAFFDDPTVAGLAASIAAARESATR